MNSNTLFRLKRRYLNVVNDFNYKFNRAMTLESMRTFSIKDGKGFVKLKVTREIKGPELWVIIKTILVGVYKAFQDNTGRLKKIEFE